ncbi:MAG: PLP-dependent aminotransferase family protein [Pseudomonadota bacterium]
MWKPRLDPDKPLYLAIIDALEKDAASGRLKPGQKLPPQRDLADQLGVNVSTVSRAFKEGERRGLISGTVGRGTFISADAGIAVPLVQHDAPKTGLIEMGLVLPLYARESRVSAGLKDIFAALDPAPLLRYAGPAGLREHRETGAAWLERFGLKAGAEEIIVTSGSQNALACCLMGLFRCGDRLAVDALTYPGVKTLAGLLGIRLVPISLDDQGMSPEALETACRRDSIRGLYLMPEFQNPTTGRLAEVRREKIAKIIEKHDLILIEDEAYGFTSELAGKALSARLPEHGIFIGGLSKAFGAGLRISFLGAGKRFREALEQAMLGSTWMASPLCAELACRIINSGLAGETMAEKRDEAEIRLKMARDKPFGPRLRFRPHGFFAWLELPEPWTGREFELTAREAGVRIFCAEKFAVGGGRAPAAVRVSLSGPETRADLARGLDILAGILSGGFRDERAVF